ncbi:MAG: hypothetical protein GY809_29450 [Planctomycetes bacterium]|nr:hypothetical protein [Planctomycetota bacterium]
MIRWVFFLSSPSFEIAGAGGSTTPPPRWDRVDSRRLIALARRIYFRFLSDSGQQLEPMGVVVNDQLDEGRVVFESPTLLLQEHFISIDLIGRRLRRPRGWRERPRGSGL